MRLYDQLNEDQKKKAFQWAVNEILTDILERGVRFNDELNGDNLQARIDKAIEKAEEMQTPWFAHEYVMETCKADIESLAVPLMEDAYYPEPNEVVAVNYYKCEVLA